MRRYSLKVDACNKQPRRGAMIVLIMVCLPIILAFAVFAINVAWMQLTGTELRTATDAAARAGSRMLSRSQNPAAARTRALQAAAMNTVGGDPMVVGFTDVVFGHSAENGSGGYTFVSGLDSDPDINGLRVTGDRRVGSVAGAIPLLFGGLFAESTFEPVKSATAMQIDRDVLLVLDRSGSMDTATPTGTRWTDLRSAVQAFLDALATTPQDEFVGLATYATTASRDKNLSLNYAQIMTFVNGISPTGNTAIGEGIQAGRLSVMDGSFARPTAQKTILVMTDGIHNAGVEPETISVDAHINDGITLHTITFSDEADQAHMQLVAEDGGGQHWHADDQASLIAVFEEIAANLPTLLTE